MTPTHSTPPAIRAIVTGHTRGLGAALATQLLRRDIAVLGVSRGAHPSLAAQYGGRFAEAALDLSDPARVAAWLAGGGLERFASGARTVLLINNAGTVEPIGPLAVQTPEAIARAVALNVTAPLLFASAVAQLGDGSLERRIAHVSSGAARNAYAGWSVYCATKAALDHHARAVALDHNGPLRIASVAPGVVDTDMQATIRATDASRFPQLDRFERLKASGALTTPDDAARKLIDHLLDDSFGNPPISDVRDW
ncbi:SDR family oxidoreductase [Burkholderia glumae]|uniref:SDR family oxidoreductase n=1 Tax=Burkholderia glumae TaxID=337 RepID=UPI000F5ECAE3|nr:SDR family oxidoreductase [Burkholderia glumae]MCQ0032773.1 SDR family oxidoreductase [Burkholderia glumae]MCQ0038858.1 SDR family oxidoreductase [Burkholderia glumae]QJW81672.1 SDR family oxidoreductase [Burkholderia glumae]RQZ68883.1 short chain dehydrogenase [Burkholderia glumae]UVS87594.1 SDR family oxidoreductase [Burkholderia glumae]